MKYLNILAFILLLVPCAQAKRYVADCIYGDSAQVYQILNKEGKELLGEQAFKIANGDTINVTRALANDSTYAVFRDEDGEYAVHGSCIVLSDDNPEGTFDSFDYEEKSLRHSSFAHLFATPIPYCIVAALMLLMIVFIFYGGRLGIGWKFLVIYIPVALLITCIIEIAGARILGDSALWFVDNDDYGWWGKMFIALPFVLVLGAQLFALKFYRMLLFDEEDTKRITIKPMAWSLGLFLPLSFVLTMLLGFMGIRGTTQNIIGIGIPILGVIIGLIIAFVRNIRSVGSLRGSAFTLFSIVYCIACVVAVWALILAVYHALLQILISIAICGALSGKYHEPTPEEMAKMEKERAKAIEENERKKREYLEQTRIFNRRMEEERKRKRNEGSGW